MNVKAVKYDAILRAVSATPWAIDPAKGRAIMDLLALRASGGRVAEEDVRTAAAANRQPTMKTKGVVAVLPVYGVIAPRMNMMTEMSGGTSAQLLGAQLDAALDDPAIGAIVLDFDTPGGAVDGVPELASKILAGREKKPIIAAVNYLAASAGYWLASQCSEIAMSPSAQAGSIGVYTVHFDESGALEQEGVKATIISAGKYKVEGNPYGPLGDEAAEYIQGRIEAIYSDFLRAVAKGRDVSVATVRSDYGQGRVLTAKDAIAVGMADRIDTLDDVLAQLTGGSRSARRKVAALETPAAIGDDGRPALPSLIAAQTYVIAPAAASVMDLGHIYNGSITVADVRGTPGLTVLAADPPPNDGDKDEDDAPPNGKKKKKKPAPADTDQDDTPPDDEQSRATTDGAVIGSIPPSPSEPAPKAKEIPVPNDTAAPAGAALQSNVDAFLALANAHGKSVKDVTDWVAAGKSLDTVKAELLDGYRATAKPVITVGEQRETKAPFHGGGDFLMAVRRATVPGGAMDPRLLPLAGPAGASEGVQADGGFLVYPEFSQQLIFRTYQAGEVLKRVRRIPMSGPAGSLVIPAVNETSRANGQRWGGVQVFWANEADATTGSNPKFRRIEVKPEKLLAVFFATDELLSDAAALETYALMAFQDEMTFVLEDNILNGGGAGTLLGILNGPAVVQVSKESGQSAGTVVAANVIKMRSRMWAPLRKNAVWFINQDVEPQLLQMFIPNTTIPIYTPPGGLSGAPYATLFGNPVIPIEYSATVGTVGDIVYAAMEEYLVVEKGGVQMAQSIHVKFLTAEQAFRFEHRVGGQPLWNSTLTPKNGTNTLAPWVTLQAR